MPGKGEEDGGVKQGEEESRVTEREVEGEVEDEGMGMQAHSPQLLPGGFDDICTHINSPVAIAL